MTGSRRVRVLLNHQSGVGGVSSAQLCQRFADHGVPCEITILNRGFDLRALAASDDPEIVWVAGGGDGTVNSVARAIFGSERTMAVLPCGTLNHFVQDLKIPSDLEQAIRIAATCPARFVDAAEVNGVIFVNNSSLGIYPAMVLDRERLKKGGGNKWLSLVIACARAFVRFRSLHVRVEVAGITREYRTPLLFVGNNPYQIEGGNLGCRERLDTGRLALYLVPGATRTSMLRLFGRALLGRVREEGTLVEVAAEHLTVRAKHRRLRVAFDGEVRRMAPPLLYRTLPGALRVIAPVEGAL